MGLLKAALVLAIGTLFGVIAWHTSASNTKVAVFFSFLAGISAVTGGVMFLDWALERGAIHTAMIRDALAVTPASKLAEAISNMEPWQSDIMRRHAIEIAMIVNPDAVPSYAIHAPNSDVPLEFAAEFLALTVYPYLCPIRHYSEGSHERTWAQSLTDLIIIHGWAVPAVGNRPAALVVPLSVVTERLGL